MRRRQLLLLGALLSFRPLQAQERSLPDLLKIMRPAVVMITAYDSLNKPAWTGTGFFITAQILVTNYHMIDGASSIDIKLESGKIVPVTGVISEDPLADLAKLTVSAADKDHGTLPIAAERAIEGQRIAVLGNPKELEKTFSDGIVAAYRDDPEIGKRMQITAPISHGSSGSPVVNMAGFVVGVVTSNRPGGQNLNFAAPMDMISAMKTHECLAFEAWGARERATMLSSPDGLYKLALKSYNNDDYLASSRLCESSLVRNPTSSKSWILLSYDEAQLGRDESAINSAEQAVKVDSSNHAAWETLGNAYRKSKRLQEAIICLKRALLLDSLNDEYLNSLAVALNSADRKQESMAMYRRAIRFGPDNANASCNYGIALYNAGDDTDAITYLTQAAVASPKWSKPHLYLAYCYSRSEKYADEESEANKAIALYPNYFAAHLLLGRHYYYKKAYADARKELEICLQIDSTDQDALSFMGWSHLYDAAVKSSLNYLIACERNYPKDVNAILDVGFAFYTDSSYGDAIRAYNRALKLDPTNVIAYNRLAWVFERLQDYTQALESYKNALEIDPQNPYTLASMGEMYLKKREYENAEEYLKSSLALKEDNTQAKASLGIACLHAGKRAEALGIYDSIKAADPKNAQRLFVEIYPDKK